MGERRGRLKEEGRVACWSARLWVDLIHCSKETEEVYDSDKSRGCTRGDVKIGLGKNGVIDGEIIAGEKMDHCAITSIRLLVWSFAAV